MAANAACCSLIFYYYSQNLQRNAQANIQRFDFDHLGYKRGKMIQFNSKRKMDTIPVINQTVPIIEPQEILIPEVTVSAQSSNLLLYLSVAALLLIFFILWNRKKTTTNRRQIALVGQRGSGKTQLFISLCGGKAFQTVPSIVNNSCQLSLQGKQFLLTDFMGDNLSRQEVINELVRFKVVVQVVDGTDSKKLSDVALFIYRVLISKNYQKQPCPFVIFFNKADQNIFHGTEKLIKRIQDEIQTIKASRRNQQEDNQNEQDTLKIERSRFDLKNKEISVVTGSARVSEPNIKALIQYLQETCL